MRKRFSTIFIMAAIAVASIIAFQSYWVYSNYKNVERNFRSTAANVLEKTVMEYYFAQAGQPYSSNTKTSFGGVLIRTSADSGSFDTSKTVKPFRLRFAATPHKILADSVEIMRLIPPTLPKGIDLNILQKQFKTGLSKTGINAPVKLLLFKNQVRMAPDEVAVEIFFSNPPVVIKAIVDNRQWIFYKNLIPALVSLLLILLSGGSLWYMGVIIKRQLKLDQIKTDFINNITHEFRTPITILRSSNEAILNFEVGKDPQKLARYIDINASILDKLDSDIERVLEITQNEIGSLSADLKPTNIKKLIDRLLLAFSLFDHATFHFDWNLKQEEIMTDGNCVETILNNLIDNALKYSGDHPDISIKASAAKDKWQLRVSDNGKGIRPDQISLIFDKFYRVSTGDVHDIKGYGLGLYQVKQLVLALKGKISVVSMEGRGTTFTIEFPL